MGQPFIKPEFDVDFYAVYDTVMDDFLAGGSLAAWDGYWYYNPTPERFARADEYGTSEVPREGREHHYGWDCEQFLLHRSDGAWWLQRRDVAEYTRRKNRSEPVGNLLEPIEHDPNPIQGLTMEDLQSKWKKERS